MQPRIGRTFEDGTVSVRYRWRQLRITCDHRNPAPSGGAAGVWLMVKQLDPEGIQGDIDYKKIRELTADIIEWPAELTPLTYGGTDATTFPDNAA